MLYNYKKHSKKLKALNKIIIALDESLRRNKTVVLLSFYCDFYSRISLWF